MPALPNKNIPIALLPVDIRTWIFSELCAYEVGKILAKLKPASGKENIVALLVGRVVIKDLTAKNFISELSRELHIPIPAAQVVGTEVKNTVLKPIANSLWKNLQIDVEDLTKTPAPPPAAVKPVAHETKFELPKTVSQPSVGQLASQEKLKSSSWQPTPKARVMEFTPMTDVKKPVGISELRKKDEYTNKAKPEPAVIPVAKPFGLAETAPKAPEPHEIVEYKDDHPVKEG